MTDTVVPSLIVHELLNQNNYEDWSLRVKTYLLAEDLWDVVEATTEPPKREDGEVEFKAWRKSNAKALHSIQISCGADTFSFIRGTSTAKVAWDILAEKLKPAKASQATGIKEIFDNDTNSNPTIFDTKPEEGSTIEESFEKGHEDNHVNRTVVNLMKNDDWDAAKKFLIDHPDPEAVSALIRDDKTILHRAVLGRKVDFAKILVHLMRPEDLEIKTDWGFTALHHVIIRTPEQVELAKCMVDKKKELLNIVFPHNKLPLLVRAQYIEEGEKMAKYLYDVTPHKILNDSHCATLIIAGFKLKRFDIAWDLINRYPKLAITESLSKKTPLNQLVGMHSAFLSGSSLNFWEQWIYDGIQIKPMRTIDNKEKPIPTTDDTCINVQEPENDDQSNQGHLISSGASLFLGLVVKTFSKLLGCTFDRIYKMKLAHVRILEFLPRMCEVIKNKNVNELQGLKTAMFLAAQKGHVEYITHLCRANAKLQNITNEKGRNIFQVAAESRQHKVFSLVNGVDPQETRRWLVNRYDDLGNNTLHLVGTISSVAQINHIRGAALQMQRELQWFKEVERISNDIAPEVINLPDKMTPQELFTTGHKELVKGGEKEMKETATSCTVVGALIVTIMFAAAFTVPGGTNQDTGHPIFLSKRAFITFIVADVISLFSSTTSVMIFLGILTSRYAESDFLKSLPAKMIWGLITLFVSIAGMMIAFSSALSIMLHGKSSIAIVVTSLAIVPVASFIWMQFPLLLELVISTYGAGVFERKIKNWPREDPKYSVSCLRDYK